LKFYLDLDEALGGERGKLVAPKGHRRLRYENCGCENDRDVIGAINILKRGCGELPLPPKAPHEPLNYR